MSKTKIGTNIYVVEKETYSKDELSSKTEAIGIFLTELEAKEFICAEVRKNYGDAFTYSTRFNPFYENRIEIVINYKDGDYATEKTVAELTYKKEQILTDDDHKKLKNMNSELAAYRAKNY